MTSQPLALPNYSSLGAVKEHWLDGTLEDYLSSAGWEELGNGCYCTAYLSPDGSRVLKVGWGWGQRATLDAAQANLGNPHLPHVYGLIDLGEEGESDFAAEVEFLLPSDDEESGETEYDDDYGEYAHPEVTAWRKSWHPKKFRRNPDLFKGRRNGPMKAAVRALITAHEDFGGNWDCHSGNLMFRPSDGALVLNDLIA